MVPGFRQSEVLHTNGYFQYGSGGSNFGVIGLETSVVNVGESGNAVLRVLRTQGSDGTVTVDYRTVAGSATAGSDYSQRSGTLTFLQGETSKSVTIPILTDSATEGNETFAFTIDNIQGGATLLVPRTATITIADDDLPNYGDFASTAGLNLNGSAASVNSALRLTPATNNRAGSAFYNAPLPVGADTSFQSSFEFRINGGQGSGGADGMTFVMQNASGGSSTIGGGAGGVGYSGIDNSLAIEFDTYQNAQDVNANHVSILVNGSLSGSLDTRSPGFDLNGVSSVHAWVEYNGITNELNVFVGQSATKPNQPLVSATVALDDIVGAQAYMGFTAGTGGLNNNHEILDWQFNTNVPDPSDPPPPGTELTNELVASGLVAPTAIAWTPDGSNLYIAEQRGIIRVVQNGTLLSSPLLDFQDRVNGTRDRGLLDIAVHPDLDNNPYAYLLYTYDPPEVFSNASHPLAGPDRNGNRAGRLTRVTLDASTGYTSIVANSEVVLVGTNSTWGNFNAFANSTNDFNEPPGGILPNGTNIQDFIATDSESHTIGTVTFGPDGNLYVSIGDGTSYNQVDPRTSRVQDVDNFSGKILRIDPITGEGLTDNPFYNGDPNANRSKVYQMGLRNPFRTTVHPVTGQVYIGDVGWVTWEEINAGNPGDNFGWPYYEGGSGTSNRTSGYRDLPEAAAFYNNVTVTPSILALNHAADGINAIVLGDVYTGGTYPTEYAGDLFFNDLGQGIVRNVSFDASGDITSVDTFTTGANIVVMIAQGPDGNLYYVDLNDGQVGRWVFV